VVRINENQLFGGIPYDAGGVYGGLPNDVRLAELCPEEFKAEGNPWLEFIKLMFEAFDHLQGVHKRHWKWKEEDYDERKWQYSCFQTLITDTGGRLTRKDRFSVLAWMLSEVLEEVPEFIAVDLPEEEDRSGWFGVLGRI